MSRGQEITKKETPMKSPLRILHLEDNPNDAELVRSTLELEDIPLEIVRVETNSEFTKALESGPFDLIISDFTLPSFDGLSALKIARKLRPDIPYIFVSGTLGEDAAIEAMKHGATDYVLKNKLAKLAPAVHRCLEEARERTRRKKVEEELRESYEFIQRIGETTPNILYVLDFKSFELRYLNQTAVRALGYTKEQVESYGSKLFKTIMHPDDYAKLSQRFSVFSMASDAHVTENEYRIRDANGEWRMFLTRETIFIRNEDQSPRLIMGTAMDITERKRAEEALRTSEEKYRSLIKQMNDGLLVVDNNDAIQFVNEKFCKIFGYTKEELIGNIGYRMLLPEESWNLLQEKNRQRKHGISDQYELEMKKKSGKRFWVSVSASPIYDPKGEVIGSLGIFSDITERKQAESKLRESEERLRLAITAANQGLFDIDVRTGSAITSPEYARMLGYEPDELHETFAKWVQRTHPDDRHKVLGGYKKYFAGQRDENSVEIRQQTKSGEWKWFFTIGKAVEFDEHEHPLRIIGTQTDITERKQAEEALRQSEQQFRLISENVADLIAVLDLNGKRLYNSPSYGPILGDPRSLRGTDSFQEIHPEDREKIKRIFQETVKTGIGQRAEYRFLLKDGSIRSIESQGSVIRDDSGSASQVVVVSRDITEKKKLEQQFLRAQRMESIGTLAGGIAHDLNNILSPILLAIEILRKKYPNESDQVLLNTLEASAQRGAGIVKQVLTFARGAEGERTEVQLKHLVSEFEKIARDTFPRSIQITTRTSKDLWTTTSDPTQLYQILMNLGVNARDAMPNGGRLQIETENIMIDEQYARMHVDAKQGPYALISVSDTGTGIPPHVIDKIFEPFFTTKETGKGTGLGLSTVIGIVKSHGGFVNVYSEVGKGTTFKVYLPATRRNETQKGKEEQPELPVGKGELILVVDDEAAIREITKATLEAYGYKVQDANDGTEGVALYVQSKGKIKLVLTDIMMPFMDGPAMIRALQKINREVKIIAVSGLAENVKVSEVAGTGEITFIQKPYTTEKLLTTLREVLDKNL